MASSADATPAAPTEPPRLKARIRRLYDGNGRTSMLFRWSMFGVDVVTIGLFIEMTFFAETRFVLALELTLGVIILIDLIARFYISRSRLRFVVRPVTIADVIVVFSMLGAALAENLGFLRVLRALRLFRSYHVLGMMRRRSPWVRRNEEVIVSIVNLAVFVFTTTALVFVTQHQINPGITNYVDALYFTVATLTTTGFGDITLVGDWGHLISVMIMILGLSLFVRLLQTVFRPAKVNAPCEHCGLSRHDPDAVHCKHCGRVIRIPTEGQS
ncbi:MAG: ion channel [Pseudomonadota bacterium]